MIEYRGSVRLALRRLGHDDIAMEYYIAEDKRPVKKCLEDVSECDLYIGIFAWRYGWRPSTCNGGNFSITQMEYHQAIASNKPCFIFLLDSKTPWPPDFIDDDKTLIKNFRDELSEKHGGIPFKNPDNLASQVTQALHNWEKKRGQLPGSSGEVKINFDKFYRELIKRYQRLDMEGLTPPEKEEYLQLQLRAVFVEQSVRDNPPPTELPKDVLETIIKENDIHSDDLPEDIPLEEVRRASDVYYGKTPKPVLDIVTDPNLKYTIILGDPGSGKSTLARYIMLSIIDPFNNKISVFFNGYLPLLIELRSYVALRKDYKECKSFIDFLGHLGETENIYPNKQTLYKYLSEDRPTVAIFDGLDEIFDPTERETIARQIVGFQSQFPKTRIIVTSRIIGYRRKILTDAGFEHFTLQDMNETQVALFVNQWYAIALKDKPQEVKDRPRRILNAFKESASIRQLSGNPMLLTIMAIIGKHQELPRERWKLYDHAASVLIQHWDINKHLKDHSLDADFIGEEDKKQMLQRLAFNMQGGEGGLAGNYIHKEKLQLAFENYFMERYKTSAERARMISESMIHQFRERNFILSLYGANLFGFVHRAFLEYFCAYAFIYKFEKTQEMTPAQLKHDVFEKHWADQSWHEVLLLISGIIAESFTGDIILFLSLDVYKNWPEQIAFAKQPPWNLSLALKCLNEVRNFNLVIEPSRLLLRKICLLFDYDMSSRPQLFTFFNQHILPQVISIGASWPYGEVLADILKNIQPRNFAYIYDRLFGTFIGSIGKNNTVIKEIILDYTNHADHRIRVITPFALASAWKDDPSVLPLLQKLALGDNDKTVRYAATYAIGEYYNDNPQTFDFLVNQIINNSHPFARAIAISVLAMHYNKDVKTFEVLCEQLYKEKDKFPRTNIVKALGEYFHNKEEVLNILSRVAVRDESPNSTDIRYPDPYYVREAALYALYRFWPVSNETLAVIKDMAVNDKTLWLKEMANEMLKKVVVI